MSDLSNSLMVALLTWGTWAIAHSRSFVLSDLSESLTVAHLIWAIWANERWVSEQIPSPVSYKKTGRIPRFGPTEPVKCTSNCRGKTKLGQSSVIAGKSKGESRELRWTHISLFMLVKFPDLAGNFTRPANASITVSKTWTYLKTSFRSQTTCKNVT